MHIIIIKRKEREKGKKKDIFSSKHFRICAALQNVLKINEWFLTNYQHKLNANRNALKLIKF